MEIQYFTKKGSIYTQKIEEGQEFWLRKDQDGTVHPLIGAVHIAYKKLMDLMREYPSSLLDKTFCFNADVEEEFLEDAKKEMFIADLGDVWGEQTVICFIIKKGSKYQLGYSSLVERMEEST